MEQKKFSTVTVKCHLLDDSGKNLVDDSGFSNRSNRLALMTFQSCREEQCAGLLLLFAE